MTEITKRIEISDIPVARAQPAPPVSASPNVSRFEREQRGLGGVMAIGLAVVAVFAIAKQNNLIALALAATAALLLIGMMFLKPRFTPRQNLAAVAASLADWGVLILPSAPFVWWGQVNGGGSLITMAVTATSVAGLFLWGQGTLGNWLFPRIARVGERLD